MHALLFNVLFCLLDNFHILINIFALTTDTVVVTCFAIGETFTIHFQAESFLTGTANLFFLTRTCLRLLFFEQYCKGVLFLWVMIVIMMLIKKMIRIDMNIFFCSNKFQWVINMKMRYWWDVKCWQSWQNKLILIFFTLLLHANKIILIHWPIIMVLVFIIVNWKLLFLYFLHQNKEREDA